MLKRRINVARSASLAKLPTDLGRVLRGRGHGIMYNSSAGLML